MSDQVATAGWYPDSTRPGYHRWWDGQAWTDNLQPSAPEQPAGAESATVAVPDLANSMPASESATVAVPGGLEQPTDAESATVAVPYQADDPSGPDSSTVAVPYQAGDPSGPDSSTVVVQPGSASPPGFSAPSQAGGQFPATSGPPSFDQAGAQQGFAQQGFVQPGSAQQAFAPTGQPPSGFQPQPQEAGFAPNPQFAAGAAGHAGFQPAPQAEKRSTPVVFLLLGALGLVLAIVGSVLPWATVQSAGGNVAANPKENVLGIAGIDGRVIIGLAVLGLIGIVIGFTGKRFGGWLVLIAGLAAAIIGVVDVIGIRGIDEITFVSELGLGLYVVIVGGVIATLGGLVAALR